eukprot:CAMPEP_0177645088 /NCGR_PEP_ID=MMETSP0447-20121125/9061_1 /TAXON_ID=0 /ORGANISM="Stygamoeba regulata, Strain BSH-02190019" /LENGTH=1207 /DNA_ID=CAMNT_0019147545 /DNA_START=122 /DNA_END=3745 /DNA_ORIENTATION=+
MPNRNFPTSLLVTKHFALLLSLLLLVSNCLLTQTATAAFLPPNPVLSESGLSANGAACSRVPMPALVKHATTAYCANNETSTEAFWHVLVVDLNFDETTAQCSGALGVACASRGSSLLPYRNLGTAIGEAMRTGADLLLLSDLDTPVSIPAGLALHGTGSSLVAQYYPQYYSGNTGSAITALSGSLSVVSAGGSGVGSTPTVLSGLRLSTGITLDGDFGSAGVWFAETVIETPIVATRVTGSVVVTRSHVTSSDLFINSDGAWMPSSNATMTVSADCNLFEGLGGSLVLFTTGNRESRVYTNVHDNYFDASSTVSFVIVNTAQAQTRFARNQVHNAFTLSHSLTDESLTAVGENLFSQANSALFDSSGTIQSSVYGNLIVDGIWQTFNSGHGDGGVLAAHLDNRHLSYVGDPTPVVTAAYFLPSTALPVNTVSCSALVFERNVLPYALGYDGDVIAVAVRQLSGGSDQADVHMLLSTRSNFVQSVSPTLRFAHLRLDSSSGLSVNHLSAVRSQGDWLSYISGARLHRPNFPGLMFGSTYSLEVRDVQAYRIGNIADMFVSPAYTSYDCTFALHVEENTAAQVNGFPSGIAVFALPYMMIGGQTDVRIAHNQFASLSSRKRGSEGSGNGEQSDFMRTTASTTSSSSSSSSSVRASSSYTLVAPSAAYGPHIGGGGKRAQHRRRSVAVPYTVPYFGGLTLYEGAHHSFSFVDNLVVTENTYTAATFSVDNFYFGSLLPGVVTVEMHVDRNHFYTLGSSATVVHISQSNAQFDYYATAVRIESTADNNVFESQAGGSAQAISIYALNTDIKSGSALNVHRSASYNSVSTFLNGGAALIMADILRLDNGGVLSLHHDVYRLNYDCELRGNQWLREQGAGDFAGTFMTVVVSTTNGFSSTFDRPVHAHHSILLDDNHFNEHCETTSGGFVEVTDRITVDSAQESRCSVVQKVRVRGSYAAQEAIGNFFVRSSNQLYTGGISALQFDADISKNRAPSMANFGIYLSSAHASTPGRALDRHVLIEDNELGVSGSYTVNVRCLLSTYQMGNVQISNNRLLGSEATVADRAVSVLGFDNIEISNNQLGTVDDSVTSFGDDVVFVFSITGQRDAQIRIADNRLRGVDLGEYAFYVYMDTQAITNTLSFENNRFEHVNGAYALYTGVYSGEACGHFSGNSFSGSSSPTLPAVQHYGSFYYEQTAPDGMDLSGLSPCFT